MRRFSITQHPLLRLFFWTAQSSFRHLRPSETAQNSQQIFPWKNSSPTEILCPTATVAHRSQLQESLQHHLFRSKVQQNLLLCSSVLLPLLSAMRIEAAGISRHYFYHTASRSSNTLQLNFCCSTQNHIFILKHRPIASLDIELQRECCCLHNGGNVPP